MMRPNPFARLTMALGVVVLALGTMAGAAGAVSSVPPRIVARPHNVMVNTTVRLVGIGFPARATLTIKECGSTTWVVVAQNPCDTTNIITVHTNKKGRFTSPFKVELCPRTTTGPGPITEEKCYVGNPQPRGVDTITLVGAARVIVTYP